MLINSNNLPIRIIGNTSVSHDLVNFLTAEDQVCEIINFETAKQDAGSIEYQYLVGIIKDLKLRSQVIQWLEEQLLHCPVFVHDQSYVQNKSKLGKGTLVYPMASVLESHIGNYCMIAPNCHVGHRAIIGNQCYLLPGSMTLGTTYLENNTVLQTRATVIDQVQITATGVNVLPGAIVTKHIDVTGSYGGNPARRINNLSTQESAYFQ